MTNDPHAYLQRSGLVKNVSKSAEVVMKSAKKANIEGNESKKYEALEKKSLRSLKHGGSEAELRAGHNTGKSMKPGGGGRFAKMVSGIEKSGKSEASAKAIAASAGRKKYGKAKFQKMAATGRKRAGY